MKRSIVLIVLCALIAVCWAGPVPPFVTVFMRTVLDDADAQTARSTLGAIGWSIAPTNPTDAASAGEVAYDSGYFYVAVASNTWKRTALSTWAATVDKLLIEGTGYLLIEGGDYLLIE